MPNDKPKPWTEEPFTEQWRDEIVERVQDMHRLGGKVVALPEDYADAAIRAARVATLREEITECGCERLWDSPRHGTQLAHCPACCKRLVKIEEAERDA